MPARKWRLNPTSALVATFAWTTAPSRRFSGPAIGTRPVARAVSPVWIIVRPVHWKVLGNPIPSRPSETFSGLNIPFIVIQAGGLPSPAENLRFT